MTKAGERSCPATLSYEKLFREATMRVPRIWYVAEAFRAGMTTEQIFDISKIDPWFLENIRQIIDHEAELSKGGAAAAFEAEALRRTKELGFSDVRIASLLGVAEEDVRQARLSAGVRPVYKTVDTCGAEFAAYTPYLYSTYEQEDESAPTDRKKIVILGGGPNRIGQGIEFDYCCVHAAFALKEAGYETIMVNCNPETVSTDYDTSDKLFFEPLTREDVLSIIELEKPQGVIVQYGGQTPLKLAVPLEQAGVPIAGTSPDSIDRAEDRERFAALLEQLKLKQPANGIAFEPEKASEIAAAESASRFSSVPSYVLGGRAMEIVYDDENLRSYMARAVDVGPGRPVLIDKFLEDAIELDVDAISDGDTVVVAGIMEHIERGRCSLRRQRLLAAGQLGFGGGA